MAATGGAVPRLTVSDLIGTNADGSEIVVAVAEDVGHVLSPAMSPADMWAVVERGRELVRSGEIDGIVVTHGTATMAETAYLADLTWPFDEPIVFTGSMIIGGRPDSDGPRNVRDAMAVAASGVFRGAGATVVENGQVHAARDVRKEHKSAIGTFHSGAYGILGVVDEGRVIGYRRLMDRSVFSVAEPQFDVALVKAYSGMDDSLLRTVHRQGASGVIIECFPGRGGLPPSLLPAVEEMVQDHRVVVLAGAAEGRVAGTYGGPAGTRTFLEAGAISAGDLFPVKARILLMVLLAWADGDCGKIRAAMSEVAP